MMKLLSTVAVIVILVFAGIVVTHGKRHDKGRPASTAPAPAGAKVQTISTGEKVDIQAHLTSGYTVVEFYADW